MKVSAVAVASGGLVATFALPASAAPAHEDSAATTAAGVARLHASADRRPDRRRRGARRRQRGGADLRRRRVHGPARRGRGSADPDHHQGRPGRPGSRPGRRSGRRGHHHDPRFADHDPHGGSGAPAVNAAPVPAATGGIIGIAASLSGIYYRYGGTTTAGFDCSGFTSYVYRQVGMSLPRTAEAQRAASTKVSNPAPGDLIFFGYPAYHVGIYAGGGMMYDSPRTGKTTGLHVSGPRATSATVVSEP